MSKYIWYMLGGIIMGIGLEITTESALGPYVDKAVATHRGEQSGKETKPEAGK